MSSESEGDEFINEESKEVIDVVEGNEEVEVEENENFEETKPSSSSLLHSRSNSSSLESPIQENDSAPEETQVLETEDNNQIETSLEEEQGQKIEQEEGKEEGEPKVQQKEEEKEEEVVEVEEEKEKVEEEEEKEEKEEEKEKEKEKEEEEEEKEEKEEEEIKIQEKEKEKVEELEHESIIGQEQGKEKEKEIEEKEDQLQIFQRKLLFVGDSIIKLARQVIPKRNQDQEQQQQNQEIEIQQQEIKIEIEKEKNQEEEKVIEKEENQQKQEQQRPLSSLSDLVKRKSTPNNQQQNFDQDPNDDLYTRSALLLNLDDVQKRSSVNRDDGIEKGIPFEQLDIDEEKIQEGADYDDEVEYVENPKGFFYYYFYFWISFPLFFVLFPIYLGLTFSIIATPLGISCLKRLFAMWCPAKEQKFTFPWPFYCGLIIWGPIIIPLSIVIIIAHAVLSLVMFIPAIPFVIFSFLICHPPRKLFLSFRYAVSITLSYLLWSIVPFTDRIGHFNGIPRKRIPQWKIIFAYGFFFVHVFILPVADIVTDFIFSFSLQTTNEKLPYDRKVDNIWVILSFASSGTGLLFNIFTWIMYIIKFSCNADSSTLKEASLEVAGIKSPVVLTNTSTFISIFRFITSVAEDTLQVFFNFFSFCLNKYRHFSFFLILIINFFFFFFFFKKIACHCSKNSKSICRAKS